MSTVLRRRPAFLSASVRARRATSPALPQAHQSLSRAGCGCHSPDQLRRDRTWRTQMCGRRSRLAPAQHTPNASLRRILDNVVAGWRGVIHGTRDEGRVLAINRPPVRVYQTQRRRGKAICVSELRTRPMVLDRRQPVTFGAPLGLSVSAISSCQRHSQVVRLF